MILLTLHIVAIGAIIGITANIAYSMGKKNGLSIALESHGDEGKNNDPV